MEKFKLSVLLVEDDALSLFVYSEFIKKLVTDVYTASDGREGIKVFKKNKPDIIITDIIMPELDGLEMIREIKKSDSQVKVIMRIENQWCCLARHPYYPAVAKALFEFVQ